MNEPEWYGGKVDDRVLEVIAKMESKSSNEQLIARLRAADRNSVQSALGSRIFGEAADEIEQLGNKVAELRLQRDQLLEDGNIKQMREIDRLRAALEDLLDEMAEDTGQRHHRDKYRVYQITPSVVEDAREALGPAQEVKP